MYNVPGAILGSENTIAKQKNRKQISQKSLYYDTYILFGEERRR